MSATAGASGPSAPSEACASARPRGEPRGVHNARQHGIIHRLSAEFAHRAGAALRVDQVRPTIFYRRCRSAPNRHNGRLDSYEARDLTVAER
jgi:hypothetical protein